MSFQVIVAGDNERKQFVDWIYHQSSHVNPWLAWQARAEIAEQRIRELEAALHPFAEEGFKAGLNYNVQGDDCPIFLSLIRPRAVPEHQKDHLTLGDFRRAWKLLEPPR